MVAFYKELGITPLTSSVEHPQANDQAEAMNKIIVQELKKKLGEAKGAWVDELQQVLWGYRCSPHSATGESPFNLTYGIDAMLPVEVGEDTLRRQVTNMHQNEEYLRSNLDILPERRELASIRVEAHKRIIARRYNSKVKPRQFVEGDLVWWRTGEARRDPAHGKLSANWEGPFKIKKSLNNGAYQLE